MSIETKRRILMFSLGPIALLYAIDMAQFLLSFASVLVALCIGVFGVAFIAGATIGAIMKIREETVEIPKLRVLDFVPLFRWGMAFGMWLVHDHAIDAVPKTKKKA